MVGQSIYRNACLLTLLIIMTFGAVIIDGCGSTQQKNLWMDPLYNAPPMEKILVVAMRKGQLRRRMWEDAIVSALNSKGNAGTIAVASYQLFPNNIPDTLDMRLKTKEEGFDGVLLIARARRDTLLSDVPGYTASEPVTTYSRRWKTYVTRYEEVYYPGYTETDTAISVRTDLLVPQENGKLVWSVTSQSIDPASADQFRSSVANGVARQLKKDRFIY